MTVYTCTILMIIVYLSAWDVLLGEQVVHGPSRPKRTWFEVFIIESE